VLETTEITGIAHRERETLYTIHDTSPAIISAVLAQRGAAVATIIRQGGMVTFTVPGVDEAEVAAALDASGVGTAVQNALGTVSVVSTGITRRSDVTARALAALAEAGVEPQLVTTTPSRVSFHIPAALVQPAVRLLHGVFGLHAPQRPAAVRSAS
jgi:aspartate kinase